MDYNNITVQYYKEDDGKNSTKALKVTVAAFADNDGTVYSVPISIDNTDYVEIKKLIDAGDLTIKDAE